MKFPAKLRLRIKGRDTWVKSVQQWGLGAGSNKAGIRGLDTAAVIARNITSGRSKSRRDNECGWHGAMDWTCRDTDVARRGTLRVTVASVPNRFVSLHKLSSYPMSYIVRAKTDPSDTLRTSEERLAMSRCVAKELRKWKYIIDSWAFQKAATGNFSCRNKMFTASMLYFSDCWTESKLFWMSPVCEFLWRWRWISPPKQQFLW